MDKSWFNKLSIEEKYQLLKSEGDYIASRKHESFFVSLFSLRGEYVEMWRTIELNQTRWIEISTHPDVLYDYVKNIEL